MNINIEKGDIVWTYLSRFLRIGQGVIIMPLVLRMLPPEQISVWAIFSSILAFIVVFDLGFSNVFSRDSTRLFSTTELSKVHITEMVLFMKTFYKYSGIVLFVFLLIVGTSYIYSITSELSNNLLIIIAWFFLIISSVINFYYNYMVILLQSKGLIKEAQRIVVYGILIYLIFAVIGILLNGGLLAITFSNFISVLFNRIFLHKVYKCEILNFTSLSEVKEVNFIYHFKKIWKTTYKVSLSSLSSIALYRSSIILLSLFAPLSISGSFAFTMNFVFIISEVSFMYYYSHIPLINSLAYKGNINQIKNIFKKSILISFVSFLIFGLLLVVLGNPLLGFIGSNMYLIDYKVIILALLILFLDQIMCVSTNILFAFHNLTYVWPIVISAIVVFLSTTIICYMNRSYYSVLFPFLIIQLIYNFWKWPVSVIRMGVRQI